MENYEKIIDASIDEVLNSFEKNGGTFDNERLQKVLFQTKQILLNNKDAELSRIIDVLTEDYIRLNEKLVETNLTPGIASSIKLEDGPEINVFRGYTSTNDDKKAIDAKTRFDIASVTKLFTALQLLKDQELSRIDLDKKVSEIDPSIKLDIPLKEVLKFYHEIRTNGRIDAAKDEKEAIDLLKNATINRSGVYVYSDIPYMIARLIMDQPDETFKKYFQEELGLKNTGYEVKEEDTITGGSKDCLNEIHDPKARMIKNAGHAGIYTTTGDLVKLFDGLVKLTFINKKSLVELTTPVIKQDYITQEVMVKGEKVNRKVAVTRGMMYKSHPKGIAVTEVLAEQGTAFASSGFTGSYVNMDIDNGMTFNFLTNPLSGEGKMAGYVWTMDELKKAQFDALLKLKIIKSVYKNLNQEVDMDIHIIR